MCLALDTSAAAGDAAARHHVSSGVRPGGAPLLTSAPVVVGAVGDLACDASDPKFKGGAGTSTACVEAAVSSRMLADTSLTMVLGLGDYQYACGDLVDYAASYDPTWGRLDPMVRPVAGNHEYQTGTDAFGGTCPSSNVTAQNYFAHFGAAAHPQTAGHFSFDVGSWHVVVSTATAAAAGSAAAAPPARRRRGCARTSRRPPSPASRRTGTSRCSPAPTLTARRTAPGGKCCTPRTPTLC
jgi:hypothetical protein